MKNQENKNHSDEELTLQGERLACRYLDRWASSRPASRLQAPRWQVLALAQRLLPGGHRDWRSGGRYLPSRNAAARPRVSGPVAWGLACPLAFGAGGGWGRGAARLVAGAGGVSARGR